MNPLLGITAEWNRTSQIPRSREHGGTRLTQCIGRQQPLSYHSHLSTQNWCCWFMLHLLLSVGAHFVKKTYSSHCPNALLLFIYLTTEKMLDSTELGVPFMSVWWNIQSRVILHEKCRIQVLYSQKFRAVIAWKKNVYPGLTGNTLSLLKASHLVRVPQHHQQCPSCIADLLELTACWNSEWASQDRGSPTLY